MKAPYLFIILIILLANIQSQAQKGNWEVGITGGPGKSTLVNDNHFNLYHSTLLINTFGAHFSYQFSKHVALRNELLYAERGTIAYSFYYTKSMLTGQFIQKYKLRYLNLPFMLTATLGEKLRLYANAGPYVSYLLNFNKDIQAGNKPEDVTPTPDAYKKLDAGVNYGIGFRSPDFDNVSFTLEYRRTEGLLDVAKVAWSTGDVRNRSGNFLIGFTYSIQ